MEIYEFLEKNIKEDDEKFKNKLQIFLSNYESLDEKKNKSKMILKELNENLNIYINKKRQLDLNGVEKIILKNNIEDFIREIKKKIKIVKNEFKKIQKEQENNNVFIKQNYENNFNFSLQEMENINKKFCINTDNIIYELNYGKNKSKKVKKILILYQQLLKNLENGNSKDIDILKKLITELKIYYIKLKEIENKEPVNEIKEEQYFDLKMLRYQERIEQKIKDEENISHCVINMVIEFNHFLQTNSIVENKELVYNCVYHLNHYLLKYMYESQKIFPEFVNLLNTLKLKISKTEKKSEERQILKKAFKTFKNTYDIYKK